RLPAVPEQEYESVSALDTQPDGQRNPLQHQIDRLVLEGRREPARGEGAVGQPDLDVVPPPQREHHVAERCAVEREHAPGPREVASDIDPASHRGDTARIEPSQVPGLEYQ